MSETLHWIGGVLHAHGPDERPGCEAHMVGLCIVNSRAQPAPDPLSYVPSMTIGDSAADSPAPDPLREALLDSLRVRTSDYNYRPLSDRERDLLATQPAPDPLPPLTCPPDCPRSHEADGSHYDVRNDPDLTLASALLDAVEEVINAEALPGNIHHRLTEAYNAVVKEANRA